MRAAQTQGRDWYYGDHGYFGRFKFYRCTRNAYQHDGTGNADGARFRQFNIEVKPWQAGGRHVLLCPPDIPFARLMGFDGDDWLARALADLARFTDRPVRVRDRNTRAPLAADLRGAWALVTYVSNAAVEAVLAGVPVFCIGDCAASVMGLSDVSKIEAPARPDTRKQWAWNLAANQWTLDEMRRGDLWRAIE